MHATVAGGGVVGRLALVPFAFTELLLVVGIVYMFDWVMHNPTCGQLFQCGCTWNWAGGWDRCNVHDPHQPHCPFCEARKRSAWTTTWLVRGAAVGIYYWFSRRRGLALSGLFGRDGGEDGDYLPLYAPEAEPETAYTVQGAEPRPRPGRRKSPAVTAAGLVLLPALAWCVAITVVGWVFFLSNPSYPYFLFYTRG